MPAPDPRDTVIDGDYVDLDPAAPITTPPQTLTRH
jgi:hypothetical protein